MKTIATNVWSKELYTEKQALEFSRTLINCSGCSDCNNCSLCSLCSDCSYCSNCSGYSHCSYCTSFKNLKINPARIVSDEIGSRKSQTTIYKCLRNSDIDYYVICGCFNGSLKEFILRVNETHKNNPEYLEEYTNFINKVIQFWDIRLEERI